MRHIKDWNEDKELEFQSTHPMRDATKNGKKGAVYNAISIHASHAGCDQSRDSIWLFPKKISIHASHAGCDVMTGSYNETLSDFNPRIPCGMRPVVLGILPRCILFQSTHPMRDATPKYAFIDSIPIISIHASHAGCDYCPCATNRAVQGISIHASHAGCDFNCGHSI